MDLSANHILVVFLLTTLAGLATGERTAALLLVF